MKAPDPLIVAWQGRDLRVRHDDPDLSPYSPRDATIRSAIELVTDVAGPRLALLTTIGDRYRVRVAADRSLQGEDARREGAVTPDDEGEGPS